MAPDGGIRGPSRMPGHPSGKPPPAVGGGRGLRGWIMQPSLPYRVAQSFTLIALGRCENGT